MPDLRHLFCILLLACLSPMALGERLRLVSDDWAPYVYQDGDQTRGIDYEVSNEVFRRLGIEVQWQILPWKRCLLMVEQGLADGVLDIFELEPRKSYLVYPQEPMSQAEFVLYQASARRHVVGQLADLAGLTVGTSPGYNYGPAFNEAPSWYREPGPSHEANFGKLVRGRIDLLITDRLAGRHLLRQLGLSQQVEELPLVISRQAQYLGLARKPGREQLARAFGEALQRFKQEPAYAAIHARYTVSDNFPFAVEQQERSTR